MQSSIEIAHARAPILWLLLPTICGYALCEMGFYFEANWAKITACALAGTLILCAFFCSRKNAKLWSLAFACGVIFLAGTWWSLRAPNLVALDENFPETEIATTLVIEKTFLSAGKNWTGLASIRETNEKSALNNTRAFYMISKKRLADAPIENQQIAIAGALSPWHTQTWIGDDFLDYLKSQRASFAITQIVPAKEKLAPSLATRWSQWCREQRNRISENLIALGGNAWERESRVLVAMMFGERGRLPAIEKANFQLTGTMHIFAVSGLHVAIVALILSWAGTLLRLRERQHIFLILFFSWVYVQLAGAVPSASRAWMMICFYYLGKLLGRGNYTVPAIALVALINLWWKPWLIADLGFQLSYCVVLGIFLYALPLNHYLLEKWNPFAGLPNLLMNWRQKLCEKLRTNIIGSFAIAFTAFIATSLLIADAQKIFTPVSIFTNILLVPIVGVMLPLAVIAGTLTLIPAGTFFAGTLWTLCCWLCIFCEWLTGTLAHEIGAFEVALNVSWLAPLGIFAILTTFFLGEDWRVLRKHPLLRFSLPLLILILFLLCSSLF